MYLVHANIGGVLIKYAFEQKEAKIKLRDPKEIWISKNNLIKINLKSK